jgi:hypothetical protein
MAFWVMILWSVVAWYLKNQIPSLFSVEIYSEIGYSKTVSGYMVPIYTDLHFCENLKSNIHVQYWNMNTSTKYHFE